MRPKGWLLAALVLAALSWPVSASAQTPPDSVTVVLPGTLSGCSALSANTSPALASVLDLIRPSAFTTSYQGNLVGAGGPIEQAELVSLSPQTVVYTLNTSYRWSNGLAFNADDLLWWYHEARTTPSAYTDGYRFVKSIAENALKNVVTVVFSQDDADWNSLFRDIDQRGLPENCSLGSLVARPSLGPYVLQSLTPTTATLVANPAWTLSSGEFAKVTISTNQSLSVNQSGLVARYATDFAKNYVTQLNSSSDLASHIGFSNEEALLAFSPARGVTASLGLREGLALSLHRQAIIDTLWGSLTYGESVGASVLYSQGQNNYPGGGGLGPFGQSTTTTTQPQSLATVQPNTDCTKCAALALAQAGYTRFASGWYKRGKLLALRLVTTRSETDRASSALIIAQWKSFGIPVFETFVATDEDVANALASGGADVGVFERPTQVEPGLSARSWTGHNYGDSYDVGWRSKAVDRYYVQGLSNFNPVAAESTWTNLDDAIMANYWARPLFTSPTIVSWSNDLATVYSSTSLNGFVDQVPDWRYSVPSSS